MVTPTWGQYVTIHYYMLGHVHILYVTVHIVGLQYITICYIMLGCMLPVYKGEGGLAHMLPSMLQFISVCYSMSTVCYSM